jgi:hypothetical protein
MIRTATEHDLNLIQTPIKSVPGLWHDEQPMGAVERVLRASDALAFVSEEEGNILGSSCAHDVGFLGYLSLLEFENTIQRITVALAISAEETSFPLSRCLDTDTIQANNLID